MRICRYCDTEMIEDLKFKVMLSNAGLTIHKTGRFYDKEVATPKVAICPNCKEVSLYVEDIKYIGELNQK